MKRLVTLGIIQEKDYTLFNETSHTEGIQIQETSNLIQAIKAIHIIQEWIQQGKLSEEQILRVASVICHQEFIENLDQYELQEASQFISFRLAKKIKIVPYQIKDSAIYLACSSPWDSEQIDLIQQRLSQKYKVIINLAKTDDITLFIQRHYSNKIESFEDFPLHSIKKERTLQETPIQSREHRSQVQEQKNQNLNENQSLELQVQNQENQNLENNNIDQPVEVYVHFIFKRAIGYRATDIHFDSKHDTVQIRYRVDGILLSEKEQPSQFLASALMTKIKLLAKMDLAEKRRPQDGVFEYVLEGRAYGFRSACVPAMQGESLVIRILDSFDQSISIDRLGLSSSHLELIQSILHQSSGLFLITGPTGSGKTTTLYAMIEFLKNKQKKIVTIEDPIERFIPGISQVQVDIKNNIHFLSALKNFLRQSPDVIMIGEIRDAQTAQAAIQAALTGHLVLGTLHTADAMSTIARLINLGILPFKIASTLKAVLAQRLVRCVCCACEEAKSKEGVENIIECKECLGTGFYGQSGVFELIPISEKISSAIRSQYTLPQLRALQKQLGIKNLLEDALSPENQQKTAWSELKRNLPNYLF